MGLSDFYAKIKGKYRMSNTECRILKQGILSILYAIKKERGDYIIGYSAVRRNFFIWLDDKINKEVITCHY